MATVTNSKNWPLTSRAERVVLLKVSDTAVCSDWQSELILKIGYGINNVKSLPSTGVHQIRNAFLTQGNSSTAGDLSL